MTVEQASGKPRPAVSGARLAAVLVAVMLLLAGTAYLFDRSVGPFGDRWGDDEPDIPPEPGSVVFISQDTRWAGLTGRFSTHAEVWDGRTLTVEDCDLTVALEDLVIANRPLFTVNGNGTLRLEDTRIRVTLDPNATRAVYHNAANLRRRETEAPILSRAVNLLHATSPVLSLNVSWRASRTDLVVVGQRSPHDPMQLLARLGGGGEGWEHVEVDLSYLAGTVARVAVFPLDNEYDVLIVSDAIVLDGGAVPTGERFGAGSLSEDGWELTYFRTLLEFDEYYIAPLLKPLIESKGTLVLENCTIEEPAGLPRWTQSDDFYPWDPSDLLASQMYLTSTIGLHVQADRGTVQVRSSELLNVPLRAERADVLIQDSRLAGDADALTCRRCTGTVTGSDVVRAPSPELRGHDLDEKRWTWAVSVEEDDPARRLAIEDTRVQGGDLGLYIGGTGTLVDGCSFSGSSVICLWSDGPSAPPSHGGWPQLNATCSFGPSEGHRYFETRLCEIELAWSEPLPNPPPRGSVLIPLQQWEGLPSVRDTSYMGDDSTTTIRLPAVSVNATGDVRAFASVTVSIDPSVGIPFERSIVPGTAHETVEVDPWTGTPEQVMEIIAGYELAYPLVVPSEGAGEAVIEIVVTPDVLYDLVDIGDVIVRTRLAGAIVQESLLFEGDYLEDYRYPRVSWGFHFYLPVSLEPGPSELGIEVLVLSDDGTRLEPLWNKTFALLRVNATTEVDEMREALLGEGMLLLDPGEDLDLGGPLPSVVYDDLNWAPFNCALWNGSHLTVRGVEGDGEWSYIYGLCEGPGVLTLRGMETTYISISVVNGTLRIEELHNGAIGAQLYASRLEVRRSEVTWSASIISWTCSTVLIEDCAFFGQTEGGTVMEVSGLEAYDFNMTNTTLVGTRPVKVTFGSASGANITLLGCTFINVTVHVNPRNSIGLGNTTLMVGLCTFAGDCAYLVVATSPMGSGYYWSAFVLMWECTFTGPGTGVVREGATNLYYEDLALEDGAAVMSFRLVMLELSESRSRYNVAVVWDRPWPAFMNLSPFKQEIDRGMAGSSIRAFAIEDGDPPTVSVDDPALLVFDTGDEVVWFEEVLLDRPSVHVELPDWENIDYMVSLLRSDILSGIEWWT